MRWEAFLLKTKYVVKIKIFDTKQGFNIQNIILQFLFVDRIQIICRNDRIYRVTFFHSGKVYCITKRSLHRSKTKMASQPAPFPRILSEICILLLLGMCSKHGSNVRLLLCNIH